jgi:hypothetical protein
MASVKEETVSCRVDPVIKRKLEKIAKEERRSISSLAAILLEKALQARSSENRETA